MGLGCRIYGISALWIFLCLNCTTAIYVRNVIEPLSNVAVANENISNVEEKQIQRIPWPSETTENNALGKEVNCSPRSIHDFPTDIFSPKQRQNGAVILHVFFCLYCFLLTAYICNDYLLPALDCICADFNISSDVAGATFLATASCFPELFVNVVSTFLTESDLGVGTVVGSAVLNTFVTPACGALAATKGIKLKWHILSRDCIIYVISVSALVLVMWDGIITWYEAAILLLLFTSYFTLLFFNKRISQSCMKKPVCMKTKELAKAKTDIQKGEVMSFGTYRPYFHGELIVEYRNSQTIAANLKAAVNGESASNNMKELEVYVEPNSIFVCPREGMLKISWFLFTWPLKFLLYITIPDIRYKKVRNWYPLTFIMCVIWIAISSYLVSWMTTVVGDTLGIPDSIMGITFLSAGGNMPEMVSIVILSRQGDGDMAMSNTLGANTLDILLCLGLPWTIKTLMTGKEVQIVSGALAYSIISIIVCVIGFYGVTALYGFQLNLKVGLVCIFMFAMFLVAATLMELNVFFFVNWPMCDD